MKVRVEGWLIILAVAFSVYAHAQCQFTISRSNTDDHCLYAEEEVVWRNNVNVTVSGNNLTKNIISYNWDAGAISINQVKNNGWATTTINEVNTDRMFGISNAPSTTPSFSRSQFGIYFRSDGKIAIIESGMTLSSPAGQYGDNTYRNGDVFKIWVDNMKVRYYQNNTLLHTSAATPTLPMVVDATLTTPSPASTIQNVKVVNGSDGNFIASAATPGTGATYQWRLDGVPVGTGTTYSNSSLTPANVLTCVLTTGTAGCAAVGTNVASNTIRFQTVSVASLGTYKVSNQPKEFACVAAKEPIIFTDVVNLTTTTDDATKTLGLNGWLDAGFFSANGIGNNGKIEAVVPQTNSGVIFGLSTTNTGLAFGSTNFAFYLRSDGQLEIYEGNSQRLNLGAYAVNDVLKIEVDNNVVKYYTNGALRYISSTTPTLPLHADASFYNSLGAINDVYLTNGSEGTFNLNSTLLGSSPSYQWQLNGVNVGTNSTNYTNTSIANADVVKCIVNTGLVGCASATTPDVIMQSVSTFRGTSYIRASSAAVACSEMEEHVTFADVVNAVATGNDIVKVQGLNGSFDAGATSLNEVVNNGYAKVTVNQTNTAKVFGLSSNARALTHSSAANGLIQYGIFFRADALIEIIEYVSPSSFNRGSFGAYAAGDRFKIKVDNGVVRYYRNDVVFYTSGVDPTALLPLVVDLSMNTLTSPASTTFDDVVVSNGSGGMFQAVTANMGTTPTYQWKVNGVNTGSNTPTFSSTTLSAGQQVTCYITPDIGGCTGTGYLSNIVAINLLGGASSPSTTWDGSASTSWTNSDNWSNGVPAGYTKVIIPPGMPNSPTFNLASGGVYDLTIQPSATLNLSGTNALTVFNSWTNQGTLTANTSTVNFKNCTSNSNAIVSTASETFDKVVIDNSYGVTVTGEHHIKNSMTLTNGIVSNPGASDLIVFDDGATVTGASNASHISGKVRKIGDEVFTFPIGKGGLYRSLAITAPSNPGHHFTAEYFKANPFLDPSYGTSSHSSFLTVSGCEYWTLARSGSSTVNVTLSWNLASACPSPPYITNPTHLRVGFWNGTLWDNAGNGGTTGDSNNGTIISASAPTSYIALTLASTSLVNPLPIELKEFYGADIGTDIQLKWKTASEINSSHFIIQRASDDLKFTDIGSLDASGKSQEVRAYEFLDRDPVDGKNYYRLKSVDHDSQSKLSQVILINTVLEETFDLYPNPVKRGERVELSSVVKELSIVNALNHKIIRKILDVSGFETSDLEAGVYLLRDENGRHWRFIVY